MFDGKINTQAIFSARKNIISLLELPGVIGPFQLAKSALDGKQKDFRGFQLTNVL